MKRRTRKNPLATARDLVGITQVDAGEGNAQLVIGGIPGPVFPGYPSSWSSLAKPAASVMRNDIAAAPAIGGTYFVDDYGLKGDWVGGDANTGSGTNDTLAYQALLSSAPPGSTIVFNRHKTYRIDPHVVSDKTLTIDANFCKFVTKTMNGIDFTVAAPFMWFKSTLDTPVNMVSAGAAIGATSLSPTPNSAAASFAPGDWVVIRDTYRTWKWDNPSEYNNITGHGEINQVVSSVVGSPSIITLKYPLRHTYSMGAGIPGNPTITKIPTPVHNPKVLNVGKVYDTNPGGVYTGFFGEADGAHLFYFENCIRPVVSGVGDAEWMMHIVNFNRCWDPLAEYIEGRYPWYPGTGGHGYIGRMRHCNDGEFSHLVGYGTRHVANYAGTSRCGSHDCKAYDAIGVPYQTHGLDARDTYSRDDAFFGGSYTGWSLGNPEFNADYRYTIVRPHYDGTGTAIKARSRSRGLQVIDPVIYGGKGIEISAGADDSFIDLTNGHIELRGANTRAIDVQDIDASGIKPLSAHIRAGVRSFERSGDGIYIDAHATNSVLRLENVPLDRVTVDNVGDIQMEQYRDASSYGAAYGFPASLSTAANGVPTANNGVFVRVIDGGGKVSKIGLQVVTQSGNISLAVYSGTGIGRNRVPGNRIATSGAVACPAVGYQEVALDATVIVGPGDFLYLSCDNTTATFTTVSGQTVDILKGRSGFVRGSGHPAPPQAGTIGASNNRLPLLVAIP